MTTAYQIKPWTQVATPHDDILAGRLEIGVYAADLWRVAKGDPNCPLVYRDPRRYFETTYLTEALRSLFTDVLRALSGEGGDRVLQLRTPFGGGKTHSLIGLYHLTKNRKDLADMPQIEGLPDPGATRVVVLDGDKFDPRVGRKVDGGPHLRTLWGELAWQLGEGKAYELVREQDQERSAPGEEILDQLLKAKPTLLLLDEVLGHVENALAIPLRDSSFGRQVRLFLKRLTETVNGLPNAAMVYSLQASVHEAFGDEALLAELDHLVTRVDAKREPVTGDDVMRVVQRRLFKDSGDPQVYREAARAYSELFRRVREGFAETEADRRSAADEASVLENRVLMSYPFHPDLLDLMYHRWGSLPSYQRTRGALQFLASVVYALWNSPQHAQAVIGPGDVPLADERVRNSLFSQVGERERYSSVVDADITGTNARVKEVDRRLGQESPALQHLRVGTRLATAAFLYSFGARSGEDRGVVEEELIASCLAPGLDRMILVATLKDMWQEHLLYFHYTGRRYRFEPQPNLTKLIGDEEKRWPPQQVLERLKEEIRARLGTTRGAVLWPADSQAIPDREPEFKVVYLDLVWADKTEADAELMLRGWTENRGNLKREYRNGLAFVMPASQAAGQARATVRRLMAIESLLSQKTKLQFSKEQVEDLNERKKTTAAELDAALRGLYEKVRFPVPELEGQIAYRLELEDLRTQVSAAKEIHSRVMDALDRRWVFDTVTPSRLLTLTKLGQSVEAGQPATTHLSCSQLVDWFFSFLDFPKLKSAKALQECVAKGVAEKRFGYVASARVDSQGQLVVDRPGDVCFGESINAEEVDLSSGAYVLSAELAGRFRAPEAPEEISPPVIDVTGPGPVPTPPGPGQPRKRYQLHLEADKTKVFKAWPVIQTLADQSKSLSVTVDVVANAEESFDPVWIRNAVEEPLEEANIAQHGQLE